MAQVLDIHDLNKEFRSPNGGVVTIIDVPRFSLECGAQVAIRGASGSGKTTFLNLIAGILTSDSGRIEVGGVGVTGLGEGARDRLRATTIGYIFQTFNLLQGCTALENVELAMAFGRGKDRDLATRLLNEVGLSGHHRHLPRQLSVGQQQRVAVARAIANRPSLVLADEPTGNLDEQHAAGALKVIREMCRANNAALLLVSHSASVLKQFERVVDFAEINRAMGAAGRMAS